jgi:hypothetical protein
MSAVLGYLMYYNISYIPNRLKLIDDTSNYYNLSGLHRSHLFRSVFFLRLIPFHSLFPLESSLPNQPYELLQESLFIVEQAHHDIIDVTKISPTIYDNFYQFTEDGYFSFGMHALTLELLQSFRDLAESLRGKLDYFTIGGVELEYVTFEYCTRIFDVLVINIEKGANKIKDSQYANTVITTTAFLIGLLIFTTVFIFRAVSYIRNLILTEFYILTLLPIDDSGQFIYRLRSI